MNRLWMEKKKTFTRSSLSIKIVRIVYLGSFAAAALPPLRTHSALCTFVSLQKMNKTDKNNTEYVGICFCLWIEWWVKMFQNFKKWVKNERIFVCSMILGPIHKFCGKPLLSMYTKLDSLSNMAIDHDY